MSSHFYSSHIFDVSFWWMLLLTYDALVIIMPAILKPSLYPEPHFSIFFVPLHSSNIRNKFFNAWKSTEWVKTMGHTNWHNTYYMNRHDDRLLDSCLVRPTCRDYSKGTLLLTGQGNAQHFHWVSPKADRVSDQVVTCVACLYELASSKMRVKSLVLPAVFWALL